MPIENESKETKSNVLGKTKMFDIKQVITETNK